MNFAEIGTECEVKKNYTIKVCEGDNLVIAVPVIYSKRNMEYSHPNIFHIQPTVLEFKHYHRTRGKFWTSKPGVIFYLSIPKKNIEIDVENSGYSYVHTVINEEKVVLNVSGGSSQNGWVDYVSFGSHTFVMKSLRVLKRIAQVAVPCDVVIPPLPEYKIEGFEELKNFYDNRSDVSVGDNIYLKDGLVFEGVKGPFKVDDIVYGRTLRKDGERKKNVRYLICSCNKGFDKVRIKMSQINWSMYSVA